MMSNPPNLKANLDYITTYLSQSRRLNKEGFVLTSLSAALDFLENIDSRALLKGEVKLKTKKVEKREGRWAKRAREKKEREIEVKAVEIGKDFEGMVGIELSDDEDEENGENCEENCEENDEENGQNETALGFLGEDKAILEFIGDDIDDEKRKHLNKKKKKHLNKKKKN